MKILLSMIAALSMCNITSGQSCFVQPVGRVVNHHVNNVVDHHTNKVVVDHVQNYNAKKVIDKYDVVQKTVEFDSDYYLGLNGYYEVENNLVEQQQARDTQVLSRQSDQIDRLIDLLEKAIDSGRLNIKPNEPVLEKPEPQEPPEPPVLESPKIDFDNLDKQVFNIFNKSCANCHGATGAKAGLELVGKDDNGDVFMWDLSLADRMMVYDSVAGINLKDRGKKLMPINKEPLTDKEVEIIRLWVVEKAEEVR